MSGDNAQMSDAIEGVVRTVDGCTKRYVDASDFPLIFEDGELRIETVLSEGEPKHTLVLLKKK